MFQLTSRVPGKMLILGAVCVMLTLQTVASAKDYTGYHVFTATPDSAEKINDLGNYLMSESVEEQVDTWTLPKKIGGHAKFMVTGEYSMEMELWLTSHHIEHEIDTTDVQSLINEESTKAAASVRSRSRLGKTGLDLDVYNNHDEMNAFIESMAGQCDICTVRTIGQSYEGRDMKLIQIGDYVPHKRAIFIDAGIHAREWIAPATALNIISKMVNGYLTNDTDVKYMLNGFIWYILPSANPDGYMYSREEDRMWRKTRKPTRREGCIGTDPNRNWNYHWGESGVSSDQCSNIFPGGGPFSESETRNIRKFLLQRKRQIIVYLSFHSYGQYWLYPWGYDSSLPDDWEELDRVGQRAVNSIREAGGPLYTLGSSTNVLYAAAGASDDWAKGVALIKYSYTVELPDSGYYGFFLPSEYIQPTFSHIWPGLMEMADAVQEYLDGDII